MGASRLPGKPLLKVLGKPLLFFLIERLKRSTLANVIIVATTTNQKDDVLAETANELGVSVIRGDEEDVLSRYALAAKSVNADIIVRITADCPFSDPDLIDKALSEFIDKKVDYLSNTLERSFPRGLDIEIFSKEALERANSQAKTKTEREHVTIYIYQQRDLFNVANLSYKGERVDLRWTVDTEDDFKLIKEMLETIYPKNPNFTYQEALEMTKRHPEWENINRHVKQKSL